MGERIKNARCKSQSRGNIIDPKHLLTQYGPDILRYWASNASLGTDIIFDNKALATGKKLINKCFILNLIHLVYLIIIQLILHFNLIQLFIYNLIPIIILLILNQMKIYLIIYYQYFNLILIFIINNILVTYNL